jgi:hypothetical protein
VHFKVQFDSPTRTNPHQSLPADRHAHAKGSHHPSAIPLALISGLVQADHDDVTILRDDPRLGDVLVHFPRVGYALKELDA